MFNPIASLADAIARFVRSENEIGLSVDYCATNVKGWPDKVSETDKATIQAHMASESWETTKAYVPRYWRKGDQYLPTSGECPSGWEEYQPNFLDLYTTTAGSRGKAAWLLMEKNEPGRKKAVQEEFSKWKNTNVSQRWSRLTGKAVAKLQELADPEAGEDSKKSARAKKPDIDYLKNAFEVMIKRNNKSGLIADKAALEKVFDTCLTEYRNLLPVAKAKAKKKK
jgi:hypothetical protein